MQQYRNDYSEGAAPQILEALTRTNFDQTVGYGEDEHCARAAELIRAEVGLPQALVRFAPGGTAANILAITGLTEEFEGPLCAADAHPTIHETGAIEAHGRRLLATHDAFGVLTPQGAQPLWEASVANTHHTTRAGMLYFSNTTELGHVYSAEEFDALCDWADERDLAIYVDGARMASAITAPGNNLTIQHLASRATVFTLGGTKNGMLFGEALVVNPTTPRGARMAERLPFLTKRTGALMAKGRLMGVQYEAAFDDANRNEHGEALYWQLARHANACAAKLRGIMLEAGFEPFIDTTGNQQFFWVSPDQGKLFAQTVGAELQTQDDPRGEERIVARFVTSWATNMDAIDEVTEIARQARFL